VAARSNTQALQKKRRAVQFSVLDTESWTARLFFSTSSPAEAGDERSVCLSVAGLTESDRPR